MKRVNILNVGIDNLSLPAVLERTKEFLISAEPHYIVTINPEFLVAAWRDINFKKILNHADIAVADGIGVTRAARFIGQRLTRITGIDLTMELCHLAAEQGWTLFLLGGQNNIANQTKITLKAKFPKIKIVGAESGGEINNPPTIDSALINRINQSQAKIILLALGQVKQEKWLYYHLDYLPNIRLAIGVGGTFDYLAGAVKRAPSWMRRVGLEWLFRLIQEPRRWRRIIDAVIVFPILVLKNKLSSH